MTGDSDYAWRYRTADRYLRPRLGVGRWRLDRTPGQPWHWRRFLAVTIGHHCYRIGVPPRRIVRAYEAGVAAGHQDRAA